MLAVSTARALAVCASVFVVAAMSGQVMGQEARAVQLPPGVKAVWDVSKAYREQSPTRERICINGLWLWQPAAADAEAVPARGWGYFKVPGCWPGITDYMQKDCQTVYAHPSWAEQSLRSVSAAWYQREITVPREWAGRRIAVSTEYLNSFASVYVDGKKLGDMRFPTGEVDVTAACRPGGKHVLSILVVAMPLKGVMLSYNDTASAREVRGSVARRGLCGDVYLVSTPSGARISDVKVDTSFRKEEIRLETGLKGLAADSSYRLHARVTDKGRVVAEFTSTTFKGRDLQNGRFAFAERWKPEKLWDIHTPQNMHDVTVSLLEPDGEVLDAALPVRFGFREFWIEGRDFYLNGTRIFLSSVPLDNAQVGAAAANYGAARESMERLQSFGINYVNTHNYDCNPGSHLSFKEILRAADDVGMLVGLSQPHFGHYDWDAPDADETNGYARHAEFYVRVAQNHPSVVFYPTSHNATGYTEDMNPDLIDGINARRSQWSAGNVTRALRAEAIITRLDPARIVYHHSSGNLSSMHTMNFYSNFAPIQEMCDWFEHWAALGVKPVFPCEYTVPCSWDWTLYRGWYRGGRAFGSATVPWEFCLAEWNSQFFGAEAFQISEMEKTNLRWEAEQFRVGNLWHRWDYPHNVGSADFVERQPVYAMYFADVWPAFRTWGMSANSPWAHGQYWLLRDGVEETRKEFKVDWDDLQRPGFSPDYIEDRYERMDLAYERSDWIPTAAGQALIRNNKPVLAYIAGKPAAFTSKDHNFCPGERVEKQIIVINNSRETVTCDCEWSLGLPRAVVGAKKVTLPTGEQERVPLRLELPRGLEPGTYEISMTARFSNGETQEDSFAVHVMARPDAPRPGSSIALFDPKGETAQLLDGMGVRYRAVQADADLTAYDTLIVGKGALTADGPAPDVTAVQDGLKVIVFEQTSEVLEKRLGLRVTEYGLRCVFKRVPDHALLAGLDEQHLRDWRGAATILPPRLDYESGALFNGAPTVRWCGIPVTRVWRCGNRGNVASVLIEKPARGDFMPILDGGYSLQYSPLMEYREGKGMVLFCQMDVSGRTEADPAAERLARNILDYAATWQPSPSREVLYVGDAVGKAHLEAAGFSPSPYEGGRLAADQVLVVGQEGGRKLAAHKAAVTEWLNAGGNLLALGLDEQEANAFLPLQVRMRNEEHIAAYFEPFGVGSLLAGAAPGDVHNRAPREMPLVSDGATPIGDGVLGRAKDANVVFCQLVPYVVNPAQAAVTSFSVGDQDAVAGQKSALVTLGAMTARGTSLGQQVEGGEAGKTYTFAVFVKGVGGPVRMRLEVERSGSPWDRAVRTADFTAEEGQWKELHATFAVDKPFPEGWFAYIQCAQPGARYMADAFRLYEGDYVPGTAAASGGPENLFKNPGFEDRSEPYRFICPVEQHNLKQTYRRSSFLVTRLLSNMGARGANPLLEHFSSPPGGRGAESVVRNGSFSADEDGNGVADEWLFSSGAKGAAASRERTQEGADKWAQVVGCPPAEEGEKPPSVMLAQHDVPIEKDQWYRISFDARGEGLSTDGVTMTITNMETWRSLFGYQGFQPREQWKQFAFLVQANDTVETGTRLQIWYNGPGKLWLSDVRVQPIAPPSQGRWLAGLYLDVPEEWDAPYRFFRW